MAAANAIEIRPQPGPQEAFLASSADVVLYGGAAGGGKTFALLMEPLRHIDNPQFGTVIFRRNYTQITAEGGLWDTASEIYPQLGASSNESTHTWTFPSGATISMRHLQYDKTVFEWQGSQIPLIQFDEATHFSNHQFWYMLSRNRSTCGIRPYVRMSTNPDPDSWLRQFIEWWIGEDGLPIPHRAGVVRWFIREKGEVIWGDSAGELKSSHPGSLPKSFTFIPSKVTDNKILLAKDPGYLANLYAQDVVTRAQLLDGNWNIRPAPGLYFKRHNFEIIERDQVPAGLRKSRHWDLAGTKPSESNPDPDWTAGSLFGERDGFVYWIDCTMLRDGPGEVEKAVANTASQDGHEVPVFIEQEPGQSGKSQIDQFARRVLRGFAVHGVPASGDKVTRASAASAAASRGEIRIVRGPWNDQVLSMLEAFPTEGVHDDPIDTLSSFWQTRMLDQVKMPMAASAPINRQSGRIHTTAANLGLGSRARGGKRW